MFEPSTDPECLTVLADLRSLASRIVAESVRCDNEAQVVGLLWVVGRGIEIALEAAEREIGLSESRPQQKE